MTTVIKAVGSVFTNAGLGNINPIIQDGLIGAYRFNSNNYIEDLSGSGNHLTVVGSPIVRDGYAVGDGANGFNTGIAETLNMTLLVVYRRKVGDTSSGFGAGNYTNAPIKGFSTFRDGAAAELQSQVSSNAAGASTNALTALPNTPITEGNFTFQAISLDATGNKTISGTPSTGLVITPFIANSLTNRILGTATTNPFKIIATSDNRAMWYAEMHVAEVLIYNRALFASEINEQYLKSKQALAKAGINI